MRAVNIVGFKNSGKTTLTLALANALEALGQRVALAKHSHHPLDKPDTDTGRMRAPERVVAGLGAGETALFFGRGRSLASLLPLMRTEADILLVEGGKTAFWLPRVLCLKTPEDAALLQPELALATYGAVAVPGLPHFDAASVDQLAALLLQRAFALPGLDCKQGTDCRDEGCLGLARRMTADAANAPACAALAGRLRLTVNGTPVALNDFTARILAGALGGMLREMKGADHGAAVISLDL